MVVAAAGVRRYCRSNILCLYHRQYTEPVAWRLLEVAFAAVADLFVAPAHFVVSVSVAAGLAIGFASPEPASLFRPLRVVA